MMAGALRSLKIDKVPRPNFDFLSYERWRLHPHNKFAIEIGCGVGLHPISWAKENPDSQILAIERTTEKFNKFSRRLTRHPHLKNIFPAHADASHLLPFLISAPIVDIIYVLYPNPYPKNSQKNLRMAFSPLTTFLAQCLAPQGQLIIATNLEQYANELIEHTPLNTKLKLESVTDIEASAKPRSHFEKKYLLRNEHCQNLVFRLDSALP